MADDSNFGPDDLTITNVTCEILRLIWMTWKLRSQLAGDYTADDFTDHKIIGRGSFGIVSSAYNRTNNSKVAIKKLVSEENGGSADWNQEAYFSARVHKFVQDIYGCHPDIQTVYGVVTVDPRKEFWIVMDLAAESLRPYCSGEKKMETRQKYHISKQCWAGLTFLHRLGLVHRDIAPENILLSEDAHARLADFSLTERWAAIGQTSKRLLGRAPYHPPEFYQIHSSDPIDFASADVYALGVVLCELYLGDDFWYFCDGSRSKGVLEDFQIKYKLQRHYDFVQGRISDADVIRHMPAGLMAFGECACDQDVRETLKRSVALSAVSRPSAENMYELFDNSKYGSTCGFHHNRRNCFDIMQKQAVLREAGISNLKRRKAPVRTENLKLHKMRLKNYARFYYKCNVLMSLENNGYAPATFDISPNARLLAACWYGPVLKCWHEKLWDVEKFSDGSFDDDMLAMHIGFNRRSDMLFVIAAIKKDNIEEMVHMLIFYGIKGGSLNKLGSFRLPGMFVNCSWYDSDSLLVFTVALEEGLCSDMHLYRTFGRARCCFTSDLFLCRLLTMSMQPIAYVAHARSFSHVACTVSSHISTCAHDAVAATESLKHQHTFYSDFSPNDDIEYARNLKNKRIKLKDKWLIFAICDYQTFKETLAFVYLKKERFKKMLQLKIPRSESIVGRLGCSSAVEHYEETEYNGLIQDHTIEMPGKVFKLALTDDQRFVIVHIYVYPENVQELMMETRPDSKVAGVTKFVIVDLESLSITASVPCPELGDAQMLFQPMDLSVQERQTLEIVKSKSARLLNLHNIERETNFYEVDLLVHMEEHMKDRSLLLGYFKKAADIYRPGGSFVFQCAAFAFVTDAMRHHTADCEIQAFGSEILSHILSHVKRHLKARQKRSLLNLLCDTAQRHMQEEKLIQNCCTCLCELNWRIEFSSVQHLVEQLRNQVNQFENLSTQEAVMNLVKKFDGE